MEASFWHRLFHGVRKVPPSPEMEHFAGSNWVEHIMDVAVTDRLHEKQGRSIGRLIFKSGEESLAVYLKRHYRLPFLHGLLATIWPKAAWSPGFQEWENLRWAQAEGLPVPEVAAGGEFIGPRGRLQSFLAVKELTDMLPLHEAVPAAAWNLVPLDFQKWKRGLAAEMARLAAALHNRRRFHKDLYFCHFYIAAADTERLVEWPGRVQMIDFHRLGHHPLNWRWWLGKDLAQLWYSSEVYGVTPRDRVFFWRAYRKAAPRTPASRWLKALIGLRMWNYRRHSRRGGRRSLPLLSPLAKR